MKDRGRAPEASRERFGCVWWKNRVKIRVAFWEQFGAKVEKVHPQNHPKIVAEKVPKIDAKRQLK